MQAGEGQRETEGDGIRSRLHAAHTEPNEGLELVKLRDHDLSQNQESDTYPTEPPKRPHKY